MQELKNGVGLNNKPSLINTQEGLMKKPESQHLWCLYHSL